LKSDGILTNNAPRTIGNIKLVNFGYGLPETWARIISVAIRPKTIPIVIIKRIWWSVRTVELGELTHK